MLKTLPPLGIPADPEQIAALAERILPSLLGHPFVDLSLTHRCGCPVIWQIVAGGDAASIAERVRQAERYVSQRACPDCMTAAERQERRERLRREIGLLDPERLPWIEPRDEEAGNG